MCFIVGFNKWLTPEKIIRLYSKLLTFIVLSDHIVIAIY